MHPSIGSPHKRIGQGWQALLDLGFVAESERTVLRRRRHEGPLRVQRSFFPEGDAVCHSYVLHPPGGVVGGDGLEIRVQVGSAAHALLTTPAAGKFYRSAGPVAVQRQHFTVAPQACLEWLPNLNIIQGGAQVVLDSRVHLSAASRCILWESTCLGRPGSGDAFVDGALSQRLAVMLDDQPLFLERLDLTAGAPMLEAAWGLHGMCYMATMLVWPLDAAGLMALREQAPVRAGVRMGATLISLPDASGQAVGPALGVCRWLAAAGEPLWQSMQQAWAVLRPLVLQRPASIPRIWKT